MNLTAVGGAGGQTDKDPFLIALGTQVRKLRAQRGLTRKALATVAGISERHLANLETGQGNASVMLLRQLAEALGSTIAELIGEESGASPEWTSLRTLLRGRDEASLKRAHRTLAELFGEREGDASRTARIALVGLRGAGKSTLGRMLADDLGLAFIELNRLIERIAGCSVPEIHALYGAGAYRRYELRALEEAIASNDKAVIATGGGIVSEPETFDLLRARCFTVWLRATPEEHMKRVIAQGDLRPMAGNAEAMADLKRILHSRDEQYAKADLAYDTSGQALAGSYLGFRKALLSRLPAMRGAGKSAL